MGLASKEIISQSSSFVFNKEEIIAYNDEILVRFPYIAEFEGAVEADPLLKLLSKYKVKELDVEVTEKELIFKSKTSQAGVLLQDVHLPYENIAVNQNFQNLPTDFLKLCKVASLSASRDISNVILTCLHINGNKIEACDRFRYSRITMDTRMHKFLIRVVDIDKLVKANFNPKSYSKDSSWIHFKNDIGAIFSCKLVNAKYLKTDKLQNVEGFSFDIPEAIQDAVEKASTFSGTFNADESERIKINITEDNFNIESKNDSGWFKEDIKFAYKGEDLEFFINPDHFGDAIDKFKTITSNGSLIKFESENIYHVIALLQKKKK